MWSSQQITERTFREGGSGEGGRFFGCGRPSSMTGRVLQVRGRKRNRKEPVSIPPLFSRRFQMCCFASSPPLPPCERVDRIYPEALAVVTHSPGPFSLGNNTRRLLVYLLRPPITVLRHMCVHTKGKNEDRLLVVGAIRSGKWSATDDLEATHTVIDTRAPAKKRKEKIERNRK